MKSYKKSLCAIILVTFLTIGLGGCCSTMSSGGGGGMARLRARISRPSDHERIFGPRKAWQKLPFLLMAFCLFSSTRLFS